MNKIFLAATMGVMAMVAQPALADGKEVYSKSCIACHGTGASGAPRLGDKAAWAKRIAKGKDALYASALNGITGTAMLPRGTCSACSDDDLKAAVDYMVSQSQ